VRPLPRSFYARPALAVARDLLGRDLVRPLDGSLVVARIVECEAYQQDDPASHSFRGRTARTQVMFGPPGHLYVYFSYGMHFCMNVVAGRTGEGSAVLVRAAEPVRGVEAMAARRGSSTPRLLCAGPGRLTQALGISRSENGIDLVSGGELWIARGSPVPEERVARDERIGISAARDRPWRLYDRGSRFVSRGSIPRSS
jgi:DNA-3-methyladenine glycosylase